MSGLVDGAETEDVTLLSVPTVVDVEAEIMRDIAGAEEIGKRILMPEARRFEDLFPKHEVVRDLWSYRSRAARTWAVDEHLPHGRVRVGAGRAELSSFCSVAGQGVNAALDVEPSDEVAELVGKHMLLCDMYRVSFRITLREGGTALVSAEYNMITGSRWFAILDSSTIPGIDLPKAGEG